jgi:hypothetical protein
LLEIQDQERIEFRSIIKIKAIDLI